MIRLSFFLSGAAALLYEVVWVRKTALYCGHTTLAAASILSAFMAGLALGSAWGGRWADKRPRASLLPAYAGLEFGIAFLGPAAQALFGAAAGALAAAGAAFWPEGLRSAAYFSAAFFIFLPPAVLMGATLPVLTRAMGAQNAGRALAGLYSANLAGAAAGTAAAGFVLLPQLGMAACAVIAAGLNVCAGVGALRSEIPPEMAPHAGGADADQSVESGPEEKKESVSAFWKYALLLALTGAAAMICQVAWTRAFAMTLGSTTYAFTIVLLTFLGGMAAGGALFDRLSRRSRATPAGLGWALALLSLSVYASLPLWDRLPYAVAKLQFIAAYDKDLIFLVQFILCAAVMAVPTTLMGAVFPWTAAAAGLTKETAGEQTGRLYAANTMGAIAGSAGAGLALLPLLGISRALAAAAALYAVAWALTRKEKASWTGAAGVVLAAIVLAPEWSPRLAASGMFLYGPLYSDVPSFQDFKHTLSREKVIFHETGANATVTVLESPKGARYLRVNGKTDASETGDLGTQLLVGFLPRLLHSGNPKTVLAIGLGSGMTVGALASDPGIERIDSVEIEPAVVRAAKLFARSNHNALEDPRVRMILADARQVLAARGPKYDIITSEPSNPWIAGIANLFTREAFLSAKERLADDGVYCQWIQGYFMRPRDMKMILRTFAEVFPHTMLFSNGTPDYFIVGSLKPWEVSYGSVARRLAEAPELARDLARMRRGLDHPFTILTRTFVLGDKDLRAYSAGAVLHLDDRPILEFSTPRQFRGTTNESLYESLTQAKSSILPDGLHGLALGDAERSLMYCVIAEELLESEDPKSAAEPIENALRHDAKSGRAWTARGRLKVHLGDNAGALLDLRKGAALSPKDYRTRLFLGRRLAETGQGKEALKELRAALALFPTEAEATLEAAHILAAAGEVQEAETLVDAALAHPVPDSLHLESLVDLREALRKGRAEVEAKLKK